MEDITGQLFADRYLLQQRLGEGGMGMVYLAIDQQLGRKVAIKLLNANLKDKANLVERFNKEARALAQLTHNNIVTIYDIGVEGDVPYIIMQYLGGQSLEERFELLQRNVTTRPSLKQVVDVIESVSLALHHAHTKDIVHRDVKPSNIMFNNTGDAVLTDFGIARLMGNSTTFTAIGAQIGTPAYMPPEQWEGKRNLTQATDQYALAVVTFQLITGRLPFDAETFPAMMHAHIYEDPPALQSSRPDAPQALSDAISRAMSKDSADRFPSVMAFSQALRDAIETVEVDFDPPSEFFTTRLETASEGIMKFIGESFPGTTNRIKAPGPFTQTLATQLRSPVGLSMLIALVLVVGVAVVLVLSGNSSAEPASVVPASAEPTQLPTEPIETSAEPTEGSADLTEGSAEPTETSPKPTEASTEPIIAPTDLPTDPNDAEDVIGTSIAEAFTATAQFEETVDAGVFIAGETSTAQFIAGQTATATLWTATPSSTPTATATSTFTPTPTPTETPTSTPTPTPTATYTYTPTPSPTATYTATATATFTLTPSPTATYTATATATFTLTPSPAVTQPVTPIASWSIIPGFVTAMEDIYDHRGEIPTSCPITVDVYTRAQSFAKNITDDLEIIVEPSYVKRRIGSIPPGDGFFIIDGPVCLEKLEWWLVNYYGNIGWVIGADRRKAWIEPAPVSALAGGREFSVATTMSFQQFQGGMMVWVAHTRQVYVFFDEDHTWRLFLDDWGPNDEPYADSSIPQGLYQPLGSFGVIWRNNNKLHDHLDWAVMPEERFNSHYQYDYTSVVDSSGNYLGGIGYRTLYDHNGFPIYVYDDGTWSR